MEVFQLLQWFNEIPKLLKENFYAVSNGWIWNPNPNLDPNLDLNSNQNWIHICITINRAAAGNHFTLFIVEIIQKSAKIGKKILKKIWTLVRVHTKKG